jgi:hypothetical protein
VYSPESPNKIDEHTRIDIANSKHHLVAMRRVLSSATVRDVVANRALRIHRVERALVELR